MRPFVISLPKYVIWPFWHNREREREREKERNILPGGRKSNKLLLDTNVHFKLKK